MNGEFITLPHETKSSASYFISESMKIFRGRLSKTLKITKKYYLQLQCFTKVTNNTTQIIHGKILC